MKKNDFLLEIGVEDFPARFVRNSILQIKNSFLNFFKENKIEFKNILVDGSCKRFWIYVAELDTQIKPKKEVIKGPKKKIAFSEKGEPTKALIGFLKKYNADIEEVKFESIGDKEIVILEKETQGQKIENILSERIPVIIKNLHFEKNMLWPETDFPFPRPIRYILSLFGSKKINVNLAGIYSDRYSYNNFKKIRITFPSEYFKIMKKNGVILKKEERIEKLFSYLPQKEKNIGGKIVKDNELLDELLELNENPCIIVGSFKEKYIQLPKEIIITVLKQHQKFFSFVNKQDNLIPFFLAVIEKGKDIKKVIKNMERVVEARLEDALFFFTNDLKKDIDYFIEKLKGIVFLENLGSYFDKTERIKNLVEYIINDKEHINREISLKIAELSRFDNATELVYEFPSLEGTAGKIYALNKGIDKDIAYGIENFRTNPKNLETLVVFIADKIDTLVGAFLLDKIPKGSFDPLGLKKLATILIEKIIEFDFDIDLKGIIQKSLFLYKKNNVRNLKEFILSRAEIVFKNLGFNYDEINTVFSSKDNLNFSLCNKKLISLKKIRKEENFYGLISGFKRANNILLQAEKKGITTEGNVNETLFKEKEEKQLYNKFLTVKNKFDDNFNKSLFYEALKELVFLKKDIDNFFDKVLVMEKNESLMKNRISLLNNIKNLFFKFGDLSKIVIEGEEGGKK